jgi:N-methylhydantoinase A/oxoprolinase/acetone carboxylase beta subunit
LDAADWAQINRLYDEMESEGRAVLRGASVAEDTVRIRRTAEMHYTGQGHDVEVEMPAGTLAAASLGAITERFEDAYRALYSRVPLGVPIEALNFRVVVSGPLPDISVSGAKRGAVSPTAAMPAPKGTRKAYFPEPGGYVDTPVYDRYSLTPGAAFAGPAIIEERESTTVAGPGARVRVDNRLTLILEPGEAS